MMRGEMARPVKTSKTKTMQAFSIGMKLMLKLSKKNRDRTKRVVVPKGEESDCLYSPTPCHAHLGIF